MKLLIFIIPLNFLFGGCVRTAYPGDEIEYEKAAEKQVKLMIQTQEDYFLKHKTFFKPPDKPAKSKSNSGFFSTQECYGYYTKSTTEVTCKIYTYGIYSYAEQETCGGNWGIELSSYVGAVFAVPIANTKQMKMVSIICKGSPPAYAPLDDRPDYINGIIDCPTNTTKVYFKDSTKRDFEN